MNRLALISGIFCLVLAAVILIFADGLRRWYSGIFFLIMGIAALAGAWRLRLKTEQQGPPE